VDNLIIVDFGGKSIIGQIDGKKIMKPRICFTFNHPQTEDELVGMKGVLGDPPFVTMNSCLFYCTVHDQTVIDLYKRVTSPIVLPQDGRISTPQMKLVS